MSAITIIFLIYGFFAVLHIISQIIIAHLEHVKQKKHTSNIKVASGFSVSVIIPVFNEDPSILSACLDALLKQTYDNFEIIVVDDGSVNRELLQQKIYSRYQSDKVRVILAYRNIGKRHVQKIGFDIAKGDLIVTLDSDTILHSVTSLNEIAKRFADSKIGALTGDVRVENKNKNLLTKLISYRYWTAFHQERAAQSYFSVLMCCSGPFSAYRRSIIEEVKDQYVSQRFLGKPCTFGDDRHLTNLVLERGHDVVFDNQAVAHTYVPDTVAQYIRQQIRWNKSFYREMMWTLRHATKHHPYLLYELLHQFVMPFMLIFALSYVIGRGITIGDGHLLVLYFSILVGVAIVRSFYGLFRTRDIGFLLFILYAFFHVFILVPTRIFALLTIWQTKWGTRIDADENNVVMPTKSMTGVGFVYTSAVALIILFLIAGIHSVSVAANNVIASSSIVVTQKTNTITSKQPVTSSNNETVSPKDNYIMTAKKGDSVYTLSRRIVDEYSENQVTKLEPWEKTYLETNLAESRKSTRIKVGDALAYTATEIGMILKKIITQTSAQIADWMQYAKVAGIK